MLTKRVNAEGYIKDQYGVSAEYPWSRYDDNAVFRRKDNRKWFALIMKVGRDKLGAKAGEISNKCGTAKDNGTVDVINLKISDSLYHDALIKEEGIYPAYHMNKQNWITVLLDGSVPDKQVFSLIDISFLSTGRSSKKQEDRPAKEWIIPSNPKFYDVIGAFDKEDEIDWKQGAGIRTGDTVYLYVASPVSAILFKCRVTKTDIPYDYEDKDLRIKALMKIKLLRRYDKDRFTFDILRDEYGINAIRGPRGITHSLSEDLNA